MRTRKITNSGTKKLIGKFPSLKNKKTIWFESHLERDFIYLLEYEKEVIRYSEQPFKVEYVLEGKKRFYHPDFLVVRKEKNQVVEVKPKHKLSDPEFRYFVSLMTTKFAEMGYEYIVVTDETIRLQPRLKNIKLLFRYASLKITLKHEILIEELFSQSENLTITDTFKAFEEKNEEKEIIYTLIFQHYLEIDITKPINSESTVRKSNSRKLSEVSDV